MSEGLKLTGLTLADIYLGKITSWNDPAITKLNPELKLSDTPIAVVHRSDGSGTTDIFTTYLTKVSPDWKNKVSFGASVNWPVGIGGKGSEGVAGQVKQTPGGIGYFELAYAKQNQLTSASIEGAAGTYLLPSIDGASSCAAAVASSIPPDFRIRIAGCAGPNAYPIAGFSWIVVHQQPKDRSRGEALTNLLWWLIHDGQTFAKEIFYAPLPDVIVKQAGEKLQTITFEGKPLLKTS